MNTIVKFLFTIGGLLVALIPAWIWLAIRALLGPTGFWQNLLVTGLGVWFLGIAQFFLLALWVMATVSMWLEEDLSGGRRIR